tara:strand:+ start:70210 stop:71454 length:1245 start_codon:yes stop_codon:yes gene_type:complete
MTQKSGSQSGFSQDAVICVRHAQAAFSELLSGAGLGGARPTEIGRIWGLDKTLAWKVSRFSDTEDLVKAVKHIPGQSGVEIVLKAAQANGVTQERINAVRDANNAFRTFVRQNAGDRRSFEAMLAAGGQDTAIEIEERRAFYRSGSAIWGVRARVQFLTLMLRPSQVNEDRIDVLQLSGFIDFERLRSDVPWIIRRLWTSDTEGTKDSTFRREALSPQEAGKHALPMIPEFCSKPIPEIHQFEGADGVLYDEIAPGAVGKHGALTCVSGELYHSALPKHWNPENTFGRYELMLRTPVESVVFDIYVHNELTQFGDFDRSLYGLLEDRPGTGRGKTHNAPMIAAEPAQRMGPPPSAPIPQCSKIRDYGKMIHSSLDRVGWDSVGAFRGYRCELEYPSTPACLTMECPIFKQDSQP